MAEAGKKTSPGLIMAAWLVVLVPAGWGLTFTVQNALKLFHTAAPAAPSAPPATSPAAPAAPAK